jgi:hypothetical protein
MSMFSETTVPQTYTLKLSDCTLMPALQIFTALYSTSINEWFDTRNIVSVQLLVINWYFLLMAQAEPKRVGGKL